MGNNYTRTIGTGAMVNKGLPMQNVVYGSDLNPDYAPEVIRTFNIGRNGVGSMDFNFAAPADLLQQNLDLGFIIPAFCEITLCRIICTIALVGIADMNMVLGNVSAGNQFIASASVNALNETITSAGVTLPVRNPIATKVWLGATPVTNTWDLATAGQWQVQITYKDYSKF